MAMGEHDLSTITGCVAYMRDFNAGIFKLVPRGPDGKPKFAVIIIDAADADEALAHVEKLEALWERNDGVAQKRSFDFQEAPPR